MSEAGSAEHVHSEATDGGFKEKSSGGGFTGRRGKFMKPTFASMRAAVPTLESTKAVTEKVIQKGARGYGLALASSTAEMPFGMCHYISRVDAGGEAENAGVVVGNRIIEVEGTPVKGSMHADLITAIKKFSAMNLPLKMTLAPANELVKLCLAGKIKDGDLFVRDNRRDVTGVNAKDFKVWRMGQTCFVQDWEGGSLSVTIVEVKRGQVGKVDVKVVDTGEVRTVLFTDLQLTPSVKKPDEEEDEEEEGDDNGGNDGATDDEFSADEDGGGSGGGGGDGSGGGGGGSAETTPARGMRERFDSMSGLGVEVGFGSDGEAAESPPPPARAAGALTEPTIPSGAQSPEAKSVEWRSIGDKCWALYEEDDKYYSAVIKEIHKDSGTVDVEFHEYPGETYTISAFNLADASEWDANGEQLEAAASGKQQQTDHGEEEEGLVAEEEQTEDEKGNFGF